MAVAASESGDKEPLKPRRHSKMLESSAGLALDEPRWRKRNGLDTSTKVFVMTGWYPDVQKALFSRGWKQVGADTYLRCGYTSESRLVYVIARILTWIARSLI
jgi:hypothetical protein